MASKEEAGGAWALALVCNLSTSGEKIWNSIPHVSIPSSQLLLTVSTILLLMMVYSNLRGSIPGNTFHSSAQMPGQPYGSALRIGYTGTQEMDLAIYRLKLRGTGDRAFMLPFLYVLQDGVFIPYEH